MQITNSTAAGRRALSRGSSTGAALDACVAERRGRLRSEERASRFGTGARGSAIHAGMLAMLLGFVGFSIQAAQRTGLQVEPDRIRLSVATQVVQFTRERGTWALDSIEVNDQKVVLPLSRTDSFLQGGGEAGSFEVVPEDGGKAIRFQVGTNEVNYRVTSADRLPAVHVQVAGPTIATCSFRTAAADPSAHGAWVTRGWVATDADGSEAFIDGSNPWVFGHTTVGKTDVSYGFMAVVNPHVQANGRTEQRSDTHFKSELLQNLQGEIHGWWQLRMGASEPKEFAVLFDRGLGGRLSDVCEKYFAGAVDSLVDVARVPVDYDPEQCLRKVPLRLTAPDAFIPGWGWMMDEFPGARYPFAHDAVWQTGAFLAFEGLATDREWEQGFGRYVLDQTPLVGQDRKAYFVRRPGGVVRWSYFSTYDNPFPTIDGGVWWTAHVLHQAAQVLDDKQLHQSTLDMVRHDLDVKLDLEKMEYPPCWSPVLNRVGDDHRDDWFKTPGLAWCAYVASRIAFPETGEAGYLRKADRITDWFAAYMVPEKKLNFLQGNNLHAVFSAYVPLSFLDRYERTGDRRFLDLARDTAWVQIMTTCTTPARDTSGQPMTGTTCVGVRGCVDYDCAPNLCHEKDLNFVQMIGPLLDHVDGSAYAKYLQLHRLVLKKDAWNSAWVMEQRDTNLRTVYDNYARGMANLMYALNPSTDSNVLVLDQGVSKVDPQIRRRRDLVLANATDQDRRTRLQVRFLEPGTYTLTVDGQQRERQADTELGRGLKVVVRANSLCRVQLRVATAAPRPVLPAQFDDSTSYLSDLEPFDAQRGTGLPQPVFRRDRSFDDQPLALGSTTFRKGLGCAANTVILYRLDGRFDRFHCLVGIDQSVAGATNPKGSVFFTVHVDGKLAFESGPMLSETPAKRVDVSVRGGQMLMLRMSGNWDDGGETRNDRGDWADARLQGRSIP